MGLSTSCSNVMVNTGGTMGRIKVIGKIIIRIIGALIAGLVWGLIELFDDIGEIIHEEKEKAVRLE